MPVGCQSLKRPLLDNCVLSSTNTGIQGKGYPIQCILFCSFSFLLSRFRDRRPSVEEVSIASKFELSQHQDQKSEEAPGERPRFAYQAIETFWFVLSSRSINSSSGMIKRLF